jgi:hypothetical protein
LCAKPLESNNFVLPGRGFGRILWWSGKSNDRTRSGGRIMKKAAFLLVTLALAVASAKTYEVTLYNPSVLAGTELKAGDYTLDWDGSSMVLKRGKVAVESPVRVEKMNSDFRSTSVRLERRDGKFHVQEIRLKGTDVKLVVGEGGATVGGQQ